MRIATRTFYETATNQLDSLQSRLSRLQEQLATNRRIVSPSDDPIASARALEVTQSQAVNTQAGVNRQNASAALSQVDLSLSNATTLVQNMQSLIVQAGNGSFTQSDRESVATQLEARMNDLLGVANTTDGAGGYLFSGFRTTTQPFVKTATGATYQGDEGARELQVSGSRKMAITDSGSAIFEANPTGNGTFETSADAGNAGRGGTGVIGPGTVSNPAALTGHRYTVDFTVSGGATTYSVTDATTSTLVTPTPVAYVDGQPISFGGMTVEIKGAPASGDQFKVEPSKKQSVFETVTTVIKALRTGTSGDVGQAQLANALGKANQNMSQALDNVLTVRASVGSRLKELDYLDSNGEDLNIQYADTLMHLQDLDMVKTISEFSQQQATLEAAQKSFKTMSGLSLFNLI